MSTTNFDTVRLRTIDTLYADRSIIRGTATGGDTTTVVDSSAALPGATADHFDYAFIKITTSTDGNAPQGEVRAVSEGGYAASTGTFTVSVAFTAAVASGDTYEIHYGGHPVWLDRLLNKYSRNFHYESLWPVSLDILGDDDNDMEDATDSADNWTASGATLAKTTSFQYNGTRSLSVTDSGSGGDYAYSGALRLAPSKSFYSAAYCRPPLGNNYYGLLDIYNPKSGGTVLATSGNAGIVEWPSLIVPWTSSSDETDTYRVRLMSVTASGVIYWDDYQTWAADAHTYSLPSWLTRKHQIRDVVVYPTGSSLGVNYVYRAGEYPAQSVPYRVEQIDESATAELRLWLGPTGGYRPYVIAQRPVAEVSFDYGTDGTSTTANTIPVDSQTADLIVSGVLSEAFLELAGRASNPSQYEKLARYHGAIWATAMNDLKPRSFKQKSNRTLVQM